MVTISKYLHSDQIIFLDTPSREEVLNSLVETLTQKKLIKDKKAFLEALLKREQIVTTGIGMGVALPHAKLAEYDHFFIALAILNQGVEWNALDGSPVKIVFMIGGPDDKQTEYLQILSHITEAIKDEKIRKKILTLKDPNAIIELLKSVE